jgi:hypothetical protein
MHTIKKFINYALSITFLVTLSNVKNIYPFVTLKIRLFKMLLKIENLTFLLVIVSYHCLYADALEFVL